MLLSLNLLKDIGRNKQIHAQIQAEREKLAKIEADNTKLANDLALAQSPNFIEREVRNKLGLAREGEAVVVLPDSDTLKKLAPQIPTQTETLPDPIWRKWLKLFL